MGKETFKNAAANNFDLCSPSNKLDHERIKIHFLENEKIKWHIFLENREKYVASWDSTGGKAKICVEIGLKNQTKELLLNTAKIGTLIE